MLTQKQQAEATVITIAELSRRTLLKVVGNELSTSIGGQQINDIVEGVVTTNLNNELTRKGAIK